MVKVNRSFPAPKSLEIEKQKLSGTYNTPDVVEQLMHDFGNKCYICEMTNLQDPEIEHLIPHHSGKYRDLEFDWNNLFWSCGHCNSIKKSSEYNAGIIDCCKEDPELLISFFYQEGNVIVKALKENDEIVDRTVKLLNDVYNKTNTGMREIKCAERVKRLEKEMNALYKLLLEYSETPTNALTKRKIKVLLARTSAFAAFKRQYIRDNIEKYGELESYLE